MFVSRVIATRAAFEAKREYLVQAGGTDPGTWESQTPAAIDALLAETNGVVFGTVDPLDPVDPSVGADQNGMADHIFRAVINSFR